MPAADSILIFCPGCDTTHGKYDCPADPFGAPETITIADLEVGDFVVAIPRSVQLGTRGFRANSGVAEISPEHWDRWIIRSRPRGPRTPIASRKIRFLDRELATLDVPSDHHVLVRRLAKPTA